MNKIKVGAVSYLNTKPLLYSFKHGYYKNQIELVEDYPARIASMLLNDEIDLGLVPVAIIPDLKEHYIISDYCIGAEGQVGSVCLFSEVPVDKIERVLLDYQSKTSVALARILLRDHWKITPEIIDAELNFEQQIKGTTAGVVIGDRAFEQRLKSKFVYDLAEAWINLTGLPFVFAAWIANKPLSTDFIYGFNEANKKGIENIHNVILENPFSLYSMHLYFTQKISYDLTQEKRNGLQKFLQLLKTI